MQVWKLYRWHSNDLNSGLSFGMLNILVTLLHFSNPIIVPQLMYYADSLSFHLHLPIDITLCLSVGSDGRMCPVGTEEEIHVRTFNIIMMVNVDPQQIRIINLMTNDFLLRIPICIF